MWYYINNNDKNQLKLSSLKMIKNKIKKLIINIVGT